MRRTPMERFWDNLIPEPNSGCWLWLGGDKDGYAIFSYQRGTVRGHRWIYEQTHGPIAKDMTIDHLCRVRRCVNPAHMEAVTSRENTMRGNTPARRNRDKTACVNGHEFNVANTYWVNNRRQCRPCKVERKRVARRRAKESV